MVVAVTGVVDWDVDEGVEAVALHSSGTVSGHIEALGAEAYLHSEVTGSR